MRTSSAPYSNAAFAIASRSDPKTIAPDSLVDEALNLFDEHRITTLFVVDEGKPVGVLHIHDCPVAR